MECRRGILRGREKRKAVEYSWSRDESDCTNFFLKIPLEGRSAGPFYCPPKPLVSVAKSPRRLDFT